MRIMMLALLGGAMTAAVPATAQQVEGADRPGDVAIATPTAAPFQAVQSGLSADETTWHVRVALNVAALSCRDADERETAAAYNALLDQERVPLAHANAGIEAQYRMRYGAAWQDRDDRDMTKLYNFFAAPTAQGDFCAVAKQVLHTASAIEPSDFAAFAAAALPALERPFAQPALPPVVMASQGDAPPAIMIATNAPVPLAPGH